MAGGGDSARLAAVRAATAAIRPALAQFYEALDQGQKVRCRPGTAGGARSGTPAQLLEIAPTIGRLLNSARKVPCDP